MLDHLEGILLVKEVVEWYMVAILSSIGQLGLGAGRNLLFLHFLLLFLFLGRLRRRLSLLDNNSLYIEHNTVLDASNLAH